MNDKQQAISKILDIVVECCMLEVDGEPSMCGADILGKDRHDNVVMSRCIFVTQMIFAGFSKSTIAKILHRSEKTIDNILSQAHQFRVSSYAYRLAEAQSTIKVAEMKEGTTK